LAITISNAGSRSANDAALTLLNAGGAGSMRIYSGSPPAKADTALSGNTLLATLGLNATAFGASANAAPLATATANAITSDTNAVATGTATFFRLHSNAGVAVIQGTVGTSGTDAIINSTSITSGDAVSCSSMTISSSEV
jgi:hypothetical protein